MQNKLLIIGFVWPEPNSTAAGSRMLQLIELFQNNNYQITFVSTASKNMNSYPLEELNIKTSLIELNSSSFNSFVKQIDPSIVVFDRFLTEEQFGWRISENCPNAIRILDTEDLHFLRKTRQQAVGKEKKISLENLVNDITKREIASIYRCDLSLIISKYEYELLLNTFKIDDRLLLYLPFLMDYLDNSVLDSYPTFNERKHFMTIGNFRHEPNWNAVLYLKNKIWSNIREKLPKAEMHIYGAYSSEKVEQLHSKKDGFIIKGWIKNTEDAFKNYKVCLAPLQFGAGLKGKLIDAMRYGTPSVTSRIGAESMHDGLPWNGFICDDPDEFSAKSVDLYSNKELWRFSQKNGISIINQCFSKKDFSEIFIQTLFNLRENLSKHRLKNFIGTMLLHHTLKSTKYLSKWIEEKNRFLQ